jgi:uncharacterized protein YcbX
VAHLERIAVHPIKSLDASYRDSARIVENGALAGDREYAVVDADGKYVNGKRTADVHRLRADFEFEGGRASSVSIGVGDGTTDEDAGNDPDPATFALPDETDGLAAWLSEYFGYEVGIRRERAGGMPDDTDASGPTVVSTATIETVADWFDLAVENVRRRFRTSLEVGGTDPFREDALYGADTPGKFRVGDAELRAEGPCNRCVVPSRDPDTGEELEGFRERFGEQRATTLPTWAPDKRFDHHFKLAVNTQVPDSEWGTEIAVGDGVITPN